MNELYRQKISLSLIGKFGKLARRWKGKEANYSSKHLWIIIHYGNANKCSININHKSKKFVWHNLSGEYKREIEDYLPLCSSCHVKIHKKNHCINGHPYTEKTTYITPQGNRECRICRRENSKRYKYKKEVNLGRTLV